MDISNKALAMVLVVAVVISLGSVIWTVGELKGIKSDAISGMAVSADNGTVTLSISENVTITFNPNAINWGSGQVLNSSNPGIQYCVLDTSAASNGNNCTGFTYVGIPFSIINEGNANVSLQLQANATPDEFIGGTAPKFQWKISNNASRGGCATAQLNDTHETFVTPPTTFAATVCGGDPSTAAGRKFAAGANNAVDLDVRVEIPEDTFGAKYAYIDATGTSS